jgi:hypothetical protein
VGPWVSYDTYPPLVGQNEPAPTSAPWDLYDPTPLVWLPVEYPLGVD